MSESTTYVYSMMKLGQKGSWSRYVYPWVIEAHALLGNDLYLRSEDTIYIADPNRLEDQDADGNNVDVDMVVRWPYLDFGAPGVTKMMAGFDVVGNGTCEVRVGWDERNYDLMTTPYEIVADTVTGGIIPMPLSAPSFSLELTFRSSENDIYAEWLASNFYLQDFRLTS